MRQKAFVGDVGTPIELTIRDNSNAIVNVSAATTKQIKIYRPDGTKLTPAASFKTDGSDGVIRYLTVTGDLNTAGAYQVQGYIEVSGGKWSTTKKTFLVEANL